MHQVVSSADPLPVDQQQLARWILAEFPHALQVCCRAGLSDQIVGMVQEVEALASN